MVNDNIKSVIIVALLFLVPSVIGGILFSLNLLESVSSIIAVLILVVPIIVTGYLLYKSMKQLTFSSLIIITVICLALSLILYLSIGKLGFLLLEYFIPIILYSVLKQKLRD